MEVIDYNLVKINQKNELGSNLDGCLIKVDLLLYSVNLPLHHVSRPLQFLDILLDDRFVRLLVVVIELPHPEEAVSDC